jgi:hypothetical protein
MPCHARRQRRPRAKAVGALLLCHAFVCGFDWTACLHALLGRTVRTASVLASQPTPATCVEVEVDLMF